MYQMAMYEILINWCVYSLTCCINAIRVFHFFMNIVIIWYGNMKLCICCIALFISSPIWICYLIKMSMCYDIHALVLVCYSIFHVCHDIWYSSLIYFGISLYVIILIRNFHHIVHFDKCKCTIWLWLKLFELDTSNELSSSFWYCQRGRDLDCTS